MRLARIDALRAFAVLLVIGHHTAFRFVPVQDDYLAHTLRRIGWVGVDLFFALSGFLIIIILSKPENRTDLNGFFRKRFFRIVPILVVAIVLHGIADLSQGKSITPLLAPFLFLTGYLYPVFHDAISFTITWSLSVEATAYILFAVVAARSWQRLPRFLTLVIVACLLLRVFLWSVLEWSHLSITYFPLTRLDTIAFGGLAALGVLDRFSSGTVACVFYGTVCIALMFWFRNLSVGITITVGYSLFGLFAALWVREMAVRIAAPSLIVRALARMGLVSYFMYLFHFFLIETILHMDKSFASINFGYWQAFALSVVIVFGLALASWKFLEAPLIRFGAQK